MSRSNAHRHEINTQNVPQFRDKFESKFANFCGMIYHRADADNSHFLGTCVMKRGAYGGSMCPNMRGYYRVYNRLCACGSTSPVYWGSMCPKMSGCYCVYDRVCPSGSAAPPKTAILTVQELNGLSRCTSICCFYNI